MTRSSSDTLSLTLPARSKSRARRRKPRKPTFLEAWCLGLMCVSAGFAVLDFVNDLMLYAIWQVSVAAIWWNAFHRLRRGGWPPLLGWQLCWIAGGGVALLVVAVV
jgi:hypothetical protein